MEKYIEPVIEIVLFGRDDVITNSFRQDDNELPLNDWWDDNDEGNT